MQSILHTVLKFCLLMAFGLSIGYGSVQLWQFTHKDDIAKGFLRNNVHAGDYSKVVATLGHGAPVMVVLKGCHYCEQARHWLTDHHLHVEEVTIGTQPDVQAAMKKFDDNGTPTLITNQSLVVGFNPEIWNTILKPR